MQQITPSLLIFTYFIIGIAGIVVGGGVAAAIIIYRHIGRTEEKTRRLLDERTDWIERRYEQQIERHIDKVQNELDGFNDHMAEQHSENLILADKRIDERIALLTADIDKRVNEKLATFKVEVVKLPEQ